MLKQQIQIDSLEITSKENFTYKELKKYLKEDNSFILIEGKKLLQEAFSNLPKIEKVFIDKKNKDLFFKFLPKDKKYEVVFMKNDLIASLYTTESKPSGDELIIGIAKKPDWQIKDIFNQRKNIVFLEGIQDPGNLGAILRSSLGFNCSGVVLSKGSVNPFNTKVIRSSAGAVFKIPVTVTYNFEDFKSLAKKEKYKLVATSSNRGKKLVDLNIEFPYIFLFGNEGKGLSEKLLNTVDELITIPHSSSIESLNLGTAVSIVLWETYKNKMKNEKLKMKS